MYSFIMLSGTNGSRVAELLFYAVIMTSDVFNDGIMDECVLFHVI